MTPAAATGITATAAVVVLDKGAAGPMYRQISDSLRQAIVTGRLTAGTRLPSTRALAAELQVSRNTVSAAYDELWAEGYVEGKVGGGTFVTSRIPAELIRSQTEAPPPRSRPAADAPVSRRGAVMVATPVTRVPQDGPPRPFRPGVPALDEFPLRDWMRASSRAWRGAGQTELLGYGDPGGHPALRSVLADYLGATRGVRCAPEQVVVMPGSQAAMDLIARVLTDPGDRVWMEDPGRTGAHGAFRAAGVEQVPIPVDADGMVVGAGVERAPDARLAYVSPSHQFPMAVTLSLPRRLQLLQWANERDAWVLEDDYDSEYRFAGRPLPALQGLDRSGRVIYVGTFSRALFPGLRLGYLVAPPQLGEALRAARVLVDRHAPTWQQLALAEFIRSGDLGRHVRRMTRVYDRRRSLVVAQLQAQLPDALAVVPTDAGMHVLAHLDPAVPDVEVESAALAAGVEVAALSRFSIASERRLNGLLLGHAVAREARIAHAVTRLAAALRGL